MRLISPLENLFENFSAREILGDISLVEPLLEQLVNKTNQEWVVYKKPGREDFSLCKARDCYMERGFDYRWILFRRTPE